MAVMTLGHGNVTMAMAAVIAGIPTEAVSTFVLWQFRSLIHQILSSGTDGWRRETARNEIRTGLSRK